MDRLSTTVWRETDEGAEDEVEVTFDYSPGTSNTWTTPGDPEELEIVSAVYAHNNEPTELTKDELEDIEREAYDRFADARYNGSPDDDLMRPL